MKFINEKFSSLDNCINANFQYESMRSRLASQQKNPQAISERSHDLVPIVFGKISNPNNTKTKEVRKNKTVKILLDTGASANIIHHSYVRKNDFSKKQASRTFDTLGGKFKTTREANVRLTLPELNSETELEVTCCVTKQESNYDIILGRDILRELGLKFDFSTNKIIWDNIEISMKPVDCNQKEHLSIQDSEHVSKETKRIKKILDAKYKKANLEELVPTLKYLNKVKQTKLYKFLKKYEAMFDGTLGNYTGSKYKIELRENVTPYHARPFPIPKIHEETLKKEVERLVKIGVLKRINNSEWAAPTFIIPKKNGTVRFISDFRELNKRIKRKPFPIPKIQDLLLKLEGFKYATSLDLNMGYYHIELCPESKKLCTIVLPWGKFEYQKLPMGLCNSPDIFQEKMNELFAGFDYVRTYIDDLLVVSNGTFDDHLEKLGTVLEKLQNAGFKVNADKSFFAKDELEYLGFKITRNGIMPLPDKIQAIQNIAVPKTKKQLRSFIGIINYYRDMWIHRSEILAPLTSMTSKQAKWNWDSKCQKSFDAIKKIVSRETLLSYPNFNEPFEIHTDASKQQLGAVISQNKQPIAFYSRKLNPAQVNYTTTERELLSIVETLKEFRNILLGQQIKVYTDHKNLTYKTFNTERVMRWRLILEEYGPELIYIQGNKNIVADALSRLELVDSPKPLEPEMHVFSELFALEDDDAPDVAHPTNIKTIMSFQQKDKELIKTAKKNKNFTINQFHGAGKNYSLICFNDKIVVPKQLQTRIVQWYHTVLCHPGETRTELTISQNFYWKNLRKTVHDVCSKCDACQFLKRNKKNYGKLPPKEAESVPWDTLCVDLIGKYQFSPKSGGKKYEMKTTSGKTVYLQAVTMIDPATGWVEIRALPGARADYVANQVELAWLTRYPKPNKIILDRGNEFLAEFKTLIREDYGITLKPITARNPQANAVLERVHQTIGNIIRTMKVQEMHLDDENPWVES